MILTKIDGTKHVHVKVLKTFWSLQMKSSEIPWNVCTRIDKFLSNNFHVDRSNSVYLCMTSELDTSKQNR